MTNNLRGKSPIGGPGHPRLGGADGFTAYDGTAHSAHGALKDGGVEPAGGGGPAGPAGICCVRDGTEEGGKEEAGSLCWPQDE